MAASWRRRRKWRGNASSGCCKNSTSVQNVSSFGQTTRCRGCRTVACWRPKHTSIAHFLTNEHSNCRLLRYVPVRRKPCSLVDSTTNFPSHSESAKTHSRNLQHGYLPPMNGRYMYASTQAETIWHHCGYIRALYYLPTLPILYMTVYLMYYVQYSHTLESPD